MLMMYALAAILLSAFSLSNGAFASPPATPEGNRTSETSSPKVTKKNKESETAKSETNKLSTSINELSAVIRDSRTNASDRYEQVKIEIERKSLQADEKIADETEKLAAFTENLAHITAILVIVGAVQIIIFVWQLKEMNKATKVAGKSAQAALKTAEDIAASERAYVFANVKIVDPPTMAPVFPSRIKINFCNLGKTPAIIMMFRAYTVTATGVIHSLPLDSMEGVRHFQEGLVIAGGNIYEVGISPNISSSDIGQVGTGALTFFCCGFIEYKTITEGIRTTGYCWQYDRYPSGHSFIFSHTSKLNHYN